MDLVNAVGYALRGKWTEAAIAGASVVPGGDVAKLAKWSKIATRGGLRLAGRVSKERFASIGRESISQVLEAFGDAVRPTGAVPKAFVGRRVTTLGRTWDIEAAKELGGFRVLDLPPGQWSLDRNYEWLMEAVMNGDVFYLASPVTKANLWNLKRGDITVYTRELYLLLQAGYRRIGDYLIPPH